MKLIEIKLYTDSWELREHLIKGMTLEELIEFSVYIGYGLSSRKQKKYWRKLQEQCKVALES